MSEKVVMSEKEVAKIEVEKRANELIYDWIHRKVHLFHELGRNIIPDVSREVIEEQAYILFQEGVYHEDVFYYPAVTFATCGHAFTDQIFQLYNGNKEPFVRTLAKSWIQSCGTEIFQQHIIYGCIRESLMEMERRDARKKCNRKNNFKDEREEKT